MLASCNENTPRGVFFLLCAQHGRTLARAVALMRVNAVAQSPNIPNAPPGLVLSLYFGESDATTN